MVKGVMKTNWTVVCRVWFQCYPEEAVLVLSWSCLGADFKHFCLSSFVSFALPVVSCVADLNLFSRSHLCLLYQLFLVLQSSSGFICRVWCLCSIWLRATWPIMLGLIQSQLLDRIPTFCANKIMTYMHSCLLHVVIAVEKVTGPPFLGGPRKYKNMENIHGHRQFLSKKT